MDKLFIVTTFDFRYQSYRKVNVRFMGDEKVTLLSIQEKTENYLQRNDFMLIAWSPVDEFMF